MIRCWLGLCALLFVVSGLVACAPGGGGGNGATEIIDTDVPPPSPSTGKFEKILLDKINTSRAAKGLPALKIVSELSHGNSRCIGSYGHSVHMARINDLQHDQFPGDVCLDSDESGENIGMGTGDEATALGEIHQGMMDEGPGGGHYDAIMSTRYTAVGIGIYYARGTLWVTEDFVRL